jgi:mono/diheme cytochrome c family protein/glucose/arabinose dehydrogenase
VCLKESLFLNVYNANSTSETKKKLATASQMISMNPKTLLLVSLIVVGICLGLISCRRQPRWPPPVQQVSDNSPALTPEQSLKTVVMPPGYHLELVAAEPLVQDPVAMEFGPDGRMWIVEMPGFMPDESGQDSRAPSGRLVVLEDTNDDGRMDKRTVFLDGLILPRALKVLENGVLVGEPPHLWFARDTDGDGKADQKEKMHDAYGRLEGNLEHNANSLLWGLDNWIHTSEHEYFYRFKGGKLEVRPTLNRGQWGISMDDVGRIYRNWNEQPLFVDLVPASYFVRNPNLVRTRGAYEELIGRKETATWPIRPTRGVNRGYRDGVLRPDGTITAYQSAATPLIYRGDQLPQELRGNAFITDCTGQLVHRLIISDDGKGNLKARDAYARGEFIASTDERFRPVNLAPGPDGTFYVVDMYRGVVQDGQYQTDYLRDYIKTHKLELPVGYGRIYRVVHETTQKQARPALHKESSAQLVEHLAHPNGWWRDTAQQLIVQRGDAAVADALKNLARTATDPRTKLHALWTLDGLDAIDVAMVTAALTDASMDVRVAALRLSERWLGEAGHPIWAAVQQHAEETNPVILRQLAATLGAAPVAKRRALLGALIVKWGADPILLDLALSGLAGQEAEILAELLQGKSIQGAEEIVAGAISKGRNAAAIQKLLELAAKSPRAEALLRGLDYGLTPSRPSGGRPQTLGGASSNLNFPERTANAVLVPLPREPAALKTLLANSELSSLAKRIANRLTWPGKPETKPEIPALNADEEKRFAAGKELYASVCAGCHQADGLGKEKIAPALVQSPFATGNAAVAARILLAGKEGSIGLMPPQSATLSDDQIAAILTFIRREWGNTASPVTAAEVKEVRGLTASRKTPWTETELSRLLNAGPGGAPASRTSP